MNFLKSIASRIKSKPEFHAGVTKAVQDDNDDYYFGGNAHNNIPDHIPLYKLVQYANRDLHFALACRANTDLVCGAGYHLTGSNLDKKAGQDALEIIEKFCEHNHMDELLQRACYDMWISGNAFLTWKKKDKHALRPIDQSNVVDIEVDDDLDPVYYYMYNRTMPNKQYQQTGLQGGDGRTKKLPASDIIHWTFQAHESPFGTGLGQVNARRGVGFIGADGQNYRKKSAFESREMETYVLNEILYGGAPRFLININGDDQVVDDTYQKMSKLKPNQHVVSAATDMKVESISNAPSNKYDAILNKSESAAIIGTMSPYARIWSSNDSFSYASSKTAMASLFPLIDAMARELKHNVEELFRMILEKNMPNIDWHENRVSIHFGSEKGIDLDRIAQAVSILDSPAFQGMYDPESILEIMRNAGFPVESLTSDSTIMMKHAKNTRNKRMHAKVFAGDDNNAKPTNTNSIDRERLLKHLNQKHTEYDNWQQNGAKSTFKFGSSEGK